MYTLKRLTQVFEAAKQIDFDDSSKIILMSDCHRGDGSWSDDFSKNQNLYFAALNYYYNRNYTYIELGDGDELWENSKISDILYTYRDVFWLLSKFYNENRLYFIFGNHDMVKRDENYAKKNYYYFFDELNKKRVPLFESLKFHEGLVLRYMPTGDKIFLVHGHQVSFLDYDIWMLGRFLVRYFWKPLESFGVNDPTSTSKNYKKKELVGKKLSKWVTKEKQMLIAGHTHRPAFPEIGEVPYFNDGCCVHPYYITGIEITDGYITLVEWKTKTRTDGTLFVGREILAGPRELKEYFKSY